MEFTKMRDLLIDHFKEMTKDADHLFEVGLDKDELWNTYLDSFPPRTNEIYRERRWHDCSCCRHFVKTIGNAVVIKNNEIETIWDFKTNDSVYQPVLDALAAFVKSHAVSGIYVSKIKKIGELENYEILEGGGTKKWEHFFLELPNKFVDSSSRSEGELKGESRDVRNVFKRSLDEITVESIETVLELILQNSLYRGLEWKEPLNAFLKYKKEYMKLPDDKKGNYAWEKSVKVGGSIGKIRNHSIGTLLVNISEGMDLDLAVRKYEQIVAPSNYKRSNAIYTKKMLEDAKKTITELGYLDSLPRRFATLDDISINNILFANRDSMKRMSTIDDIFGEMEKNAVINPKKFSKTEEISIDKFISDVLPTAKEIELYLENKHVNNMVSLIAPVNKESASMFKWGNNFGWAYAGNMTDSMKERVKAAGGNVDGDLRFSIQWDDDGSDNSDLDAHCIEADGNEIYFCNCRKPNKSESHGQLDVDITHPDRAVAVENITYPDRRKMKPGTYKFFVNQYCARNSKGFSAEIEFDGQIHSFTYDRPLRTTENVQVANVTLHENGAFSIEEKLTSSLSSKEVWNVKTNQFVPVSVVCFSPNYWDEQNGTGNKHVFFMLKDCKNDELVNGFFNEYLKEDLMRHRKVFEALGSKMRVEESDDQLSGVGFSITKRSEVIVKVKGSTERVLKINF